MPITKRTRQSLAWLGLLMVLLAPFAVASELATAADNDELDAYRIEPLDVPPFELQDHTGARFDQQRLEGRWQMMMFGFTNCPDICPLHLTFLNQAWKKLKAAGYGDGAMPEVVMVSVDPDRDSRQHLADYVTFFNKAFVGVSGEPDQIAVLESALNTGHRMFSPDVDGNYEVMHGSSVFLIDPRGRAVARFQPPLKSMQIAAAYHRFSEGGAL